MNKPLSDKEQLMSMLTDIYDQLEELEVVLEASFSDLRKSLDKDEQAKLSASKQKLQGLERTIDKIHTIPLETTDNHSNHLSRALQLELGF
jgi:exonuclease VII small subunit